MRPWPPALPAARGVRRARAAIAVAAVLAAAVVLGVGCGSGPVTDGDGNGGGDGEPAAGLAVETLVSGLEDPLWLTSPPGDPRLFVVEQPGRIRIVRDGELVAEPFLDLGDRVRSGGERGLLSVAFHPEYASNGHLYVNYTDLDGDTRIERYTASADPDRADPGSAKLILAVGQPFSNHNGGLVLFGPDGMLYAGMGDGGGGGDPLENGQDRGTLLGALLRIDVDGGDPYAVPSDNPFVGQPGARGEIWAWGLRNPWRFAFDPPTGTLYVADVGQNSFEEVNAEPAAEGGLNYGWNIMEGAHCFPPGSDCDESGLVLPALEYPHPEGCSVTGGFVYRGSAIPDVVGHYFYSDFCAGFLRSFRIEDGETVDRREWDVGDLGQVLSFGVDSAGELHILSANGRVYRLVAAD